MPSDAKDIVPSLWDVLSKPSPTNTWPLGSTSLAWSNLYLGPNGAPAFDPTTGNIGFYARTAAEIAANVTPTNYSYLDEPRRYGAVLDGSTDDTTAITNWAKVGGHRTWPANFTGKVTAAIPLVSNTTIVGGGYGSQITQVTANTDTFYVNAINNVVIQNMGFFDGGGFAVQKACIHCLESNDVTIEECRFQNVTLAGVLVGGTGATSANNARIKVRRCKFDNFNASAHADVGPVLLLDYAIRCEMSNCDVIGNGSVPSHGCMIQNTSGAAGTYSRFHKILNNDIFNTATYGILAYRVSLTGQVDGHIIQGNKIDTVVGANLGGTSGAGIYLQGSGATTVTGNTIRNTNVSTTTQTLAPGAIGINQCTADITVTGNVIDTANWHGIYIVQSGTAIENVISAINTGTNVVTISTVAATNPFVVGDPVYFTGVGGTTQLNGLYGSVTAVGGASGAWTITLSISMGAFSAFTSGGVAVLSPRFVVSANTMRNVVKNGINILEAGNVEITGNSIYCNATGTGRGILATPSATTLLARLNISGNTLEAPGSLPVEADYYNDVTISGNTIVSNVATGALQGISITHGNRATINGNAVNMGASTAVGLNLVSFTNAVVTGNSFVTAGGANNVFSSSGTCTGSLVDRTNVFSGIQFSNAGTGCKVSYNTSSGNPNGGAGNAQTGDEAWSNTGVTPLMYWCTASGNPGMWTSLTVP